MYFSGPPERKSRLTSNSKISTIWIGSGLKRTRITKTNSAHAESTISNENSWISRNSWWNHHCLADMRRIFQIALHWWWRWTHVYCICLINLLRECVIFWLKKPKKFKEAICFYLCVPCCLFFFVVWSFKMWFNLFYIYTNCCCIYLYFWGCNTDNTGISWKCSLSYLFL